MAPLRWSKLLSRRTFLVILLPVTALMVTLLVVAYDVQTGRETWERTFNRTVRERTEAFRLAHLIALAKQTTVKGLFESSAEVTEDEFMLFADNLNYPIRSLHRALVWAPRVLDVERAAFETQQRIRHPEFVVWEWGPDGLQQPAADRDDYFPVTYLWYVDSEEAARGWDMGSSPLRRAAMEEAVSTGYPVMTGPLQLTTDHLQNAPLRWGYLVFTPVYTEGPPPGTPDERRARLMGFVAGPCHYGTILEDQLRTMPQAEQRIFLFASTDPEARPVHVHLPENTGKVIPVDADAPTFRQALAIPYSREESLALAGRRLVLVFAPVHFPSWRERAGRLAVGAGLGGALLTLLSVLYVVHWLRVDGDLQESRERLALAVGASGQGLYDLDILSNIAVLGPEYAEMLGHDPSTYRLTPDSWLEQLHPDDRSAAWHVFEDMVAGRRSEYSIEYRMRTQAGQWKWILSKARVVQRDVTGRPLRIVGTHLDITARKHAEEKERDRLRQILALLDNIPDMAWLKDEESRFIAVNEPCGIACGRPPEELVGKTDFDIWPIDLAMAYRRDDQEVMESGRRKVLEERMIDSEGHEHWLETVKTPITDQDGRVMGTVGIARDITGRKLAEQSLRENAFFLESLDRISRILAQRSEGTDIPDDLARAILDIYQADRVFFIYPCAVAVPCHRIVAEAHRPEYPGLFAAGAGMASSSHADRLIEQLLEQPRPLAFDFTAMEKVPEEVRRFGVQSILAIALHPQRDKPWVLGLHQCSHNRQWTAIEQRLLQALAERISDAFSGYLLLRQLKESEERYRHAQRTAQLGHWSYDTATQCFLWLSEETFRLVGLDPAQEQPSYDDFITRVHPEDRQRVNDLVAHSVATGEPFAVEYRVPLPDGTLRFLEARSLAHRGAENRIVRLDGTVMDITERRRREEELQQKTDELIRFNYTVSHDLRSPLVTIRTFLGYLEQDMRNQDTERIAKDLGFIHGASEKMVRLIDELLELSRVGRLVASSDEMSLQDLVQEAQNMVAGRLLEYGITVHVTPEPILIRGDRQRLLEVFQNLLDNAVKFARDVPNPTVEVGAEETDEGLVFFVRDNGMGIDPRHLHKLFGLFEKLDPRAEGTGIGLALVKRIIEVHGGRIWVESRGPGQGTTFRFTLPGAGRSEPPEDSVHKSVEF